MLKQTVKDYIPVAEMPETNLLPHGISAAPKGMIFHILEDNSQEIEVLDIGFGAGGLAIHVKTTPETKHWHVDGVDGLLANCTNTGLIGLNVYRNVWHGLAQEIPSERLSRYNIICLLDVIEHLNAETAKWLLRTLLTCMGDDAHLFVSTPLWFYPQDNLQSGDFEEHFIGVPASSMMALVPTMYCINEPLVGGFVYTKKSLDFIEFFQPTSDRNFSYERGATVARAVGLQIKPDVLYRF